jgi:hypothetical protein
MGTGWEIQSIHVLRPKRMDLLRNRKLSRLVPTPKGATEIGAIVIRACFKNGERVGFGIPQGLKPLAFADLFGTTKVVPCYKTGL